MTTQDQIVLLEDNHHLRTEIDQLRAEREEAERTILRLESQYGVAVKDRDAARREVCYCHPESAQFAINRDWNCFKENETP
jgi:cell division protein FtsB